MIKIYDLDNITIDKVLCRNNNFCDISVEKAVSEIIVNVRKDGDKALHYYGKKFDNVELDTLKVTADEVNNAFASIDKDFLQTLYLAKNNIEIFHKHQKIEGFQIKNADGSILGQRVLPLAKVGLYVPGGTACYPSSVLMNALPAKIAGVSDIIIVTPPNKNGKVDDKILAAAHICGITEIYKIGGAHAVAALAYGTESIPKVDKIVGPGNIYVATAKKQVFGVCGIDMIAGPSEILIIADENCKKQFIAADMLSQAEHDTRATAVLLTTSKSLANQVKDEIALQLETLPRQDIARKSINQNGKIIIVPSIDCAIEISNTIAPEHLELCISQPFDYLDKVKNAGSIFLGEYTPEAVGDYLAGTNHTLPTGGTARFFSPLSVDDFIKKSQYVYYTDKALTKVAANIELFAEQENLQGHGISVKIRL